MFFPRYFVGLLFFFSFVSAFTLSPITARHQTEKKKERFAIYRLPSFHKYEISGPS